MYLCPKLTSSSQKEIAKFFNLKNSGSVSYTTHMISVNIRRNKKFAKKIKGLIDMVIRQVV